MFDSVKIEVFAIFADASLIFFFKTDRIMEDNTTQAQTPQQQTIIIEREPQQKNGLGLAGFILALVGLFLDWIPVLGWLIWLLGAIFSIIGLFKQPRGFAIAGTIISFLGFIILLLVLGVFAAAVGLSL